MVLQGATGDGVVGTWRSNQAAHCRAVELHFGNQSLQRDDSRLPPCQTSSDMLQHHCMSARRNWGQLAQFLSTKMMSMFT